MAPVSMTLSDLSDRFQGHDIIQRQITRKWYKIELYSYNGGLIKSHRPTWSIEPRHFQWSWRTPKPDFKVRLNISKMATDTAIFTMEDEYETVPKLLNGTTFNDLEWPLTQISRSRSYLTSNNSTNSKSCMICPMFPFLVTLRDWPLGLSMSR